MQLTWDKLNSGEGDDDRYDIPKDKIRFAAANVLVDLPFHEIVKNFKVRRTATSYR